MHHFHGLNYYLSFQPFVKGHVKMDASLVHIYKEMPTAELDHPPPKIADEDLRIRRQRVRVFSDSYYCQ